MWGGGDASGGILSELRHRRTWSTPCRLSLSEIPASHERKKSERLVKSRGSQAEGVFCFLYFLRWKRLNMFTG